MYGNYELITERRAKNYFIKIQKIMEGNFYWHPRKNYRFNKKRVPLTGRNNIISILISRQIRIAIWSLFYQKKLDLTVFTFQINNIFIISIILRIIVS